MRDDWDSSPSLCKTLSNWKVTSLMKWMSKMSNDMLLFLVAGFLCLVFFKQHVSIEDIRHVIKLRLLKRGLLCGLSKVLGMWIDMVPFPQWLGNSLTWPLQANFPGEKISDFSTFGLLQFVILCLSFWKVFSFDSLWLIVELHRLLALWLLLKVRLIKSTCIDKSSWSTVKIWRLEIITWDGLVLEVPQSSFYLFSAVKKHFCQLGLLMSIFYIRCFLPGGKQCCMVQVLCEVYSRQAEKGFALNLINGIYLKSLQ